MADFFGTLLWVITAMVMVLAGDNWLGITVASGYVLLAFVVLVPVLLNEQTRATLFKRPWPIGSIFIETGMDLMLIALMLATGAVITASLYALYAIMWACLITYSRVK